MPVTKSRSNSDVRAGLGLKARAWAGLCGLGLEVNFKPGSKPISGPGLGWAGPTGKPGLAMVQLVTNHYSYYSRFRNERPALDFFRIAIQTPNADQCRWGLWRDAV